jgi:hypothetical protein
MIVPWHCPECDVSGEATIVKHPQIGEVMSTITAVAQDHKRRSPDCPVSRRPAGYVRIILFIADEEIIDARITD